MVSLHTLSRFEPFMPVATFHEGIFRMFSPATSAHALDPDTIMIIGVPKETYPGENRVAITPASLPSLQKGGMTVHIECGAGVKSGYPDAAYTEKGGVIVPSRSSTL